LLRALLREQTLHLGAVGRLLMAGEPVRMLPLDDAELLDAARPVTREGKVRLEPVKVRAREGYMVRSALPVRPVAVIVLGGEHDLSESVGRLAPGSEYIRVKVEGYPPGPK
jgi:hypothetical protein